MALDAGYLSQAEFEQLMEQADKCSRQISRLMAYLQSQPNTLRVRESRAEYDIND